MEPVTQGEGMAIADLDFSLITKRKRMMDSVGHYARPDIFTLHVNQEANLNTNITGAEELPLPFNFNGHEHVPSLRPEPQATAGV